MTTGRSNLDDIGGEARGATRRHWVLFLLQGLVLIGLGVAAIAEPMVATTAISFFPGWLFLISGIVGLAGVFTAQRVPGFWWSVISALLAIAFGVYLVWRPLDGVLSLTVVVAIFFGAQGISQIVTAISQRRALPSWGWVLVAGIANIILAAIIWSGFPGSAEWALGLLFGINLLLWGAALVLTSLASRSA
jgi:uncharacterized membrane protein HdeD (DUF308 family)